MKLKKPKKEEVKILVVDDETIVALDIKNTLEKYGYKVVGIAANSKEALQLVKSSKPNLIFMDIMIKGSRDGIETASEINELADIPIIFLTAYSDDHTLERAKLVEPYGYLIKPFDNRELFTTIEMSLYKHSLEVSIRESEENLSITLNSIGDAVISTDENGMIVKMNPVAESLTGWKFDEAKGLPLEKIFHLIDATSRKIIPNPVHKVIESGKVIGLSNHTLLIAKDGSERNISDSAAPIKDAQGNIRGVVLVFSDVTESYNSRKAIKESEEKFRQLVSTMEQGLAVHEVIYDKKGKVVDYRFLDINDSFSKLTGLTKEQVIGKTVLEVLPKTEQYWIDRYGEVAVTGKPVEFENYSKELGKYYHVVAYRNRPHQFAVIINDVTDRKIAEEELRIKDQAIASSINAIALADLKGNLNYVNKSFLEMWGYKNESEVLGRSSLEFWQNPKEAKKVLSTVLEKGSFVGELIAKRKENELLTLFLTATIVYSSGGKPVQIMASFIDVTERRKFENELIASEEKFRLLVEKAPLGIYYSNMKGEFIYGNKVAEDLVGYKKDELIGRNFLQCGLLSSKDIPYAAKLFSRSLLGKPTGPDQLKLIRKDGTTVEIEITSQVINVGGQKITMGMAQDITERKKAEERIQLQSDLLELSPASVIVHDLEGKILYANKRTLEMHGYTEEEFKKLTLSNIDTLESAKLIEERIKNIKEKGELSFEVSHRRKDGSSFPLLVNTKIARINDQNVLLSVSNDITEKKIQEEILRQKTEELDNYFTNALDLFCIANTDGYFIKLNKQWENVLGYSLKELEDAKFLDFVHPEDINATVKAISVLEKQKRLIGFVNRYRAKDGTYKFIEWRSYPAGKRIYAAARDITERKLAEDALRASEEMFRSYVENAPDAIMVVDEKGNYVQVNKAACDLTGYTRDELLKMHIMDVTYSEDFSKGKEHFKNVVEKGEATAEVRFVTKSGEVRYWSVKAVKLNDTRFLGFQTDITEKKLAEIALKESEEKYRRFFEEDLSGDFITSPDGIILSCNIAFAKIFGFESVDEIIKIPISSFYKDLDNRRKFIQKIIENKKLVEFEEELINKDGKAITVLENVSGIFDEQGNLIEVRGYLIDITEHKIAEKTLRESEEKFRTLISSLKDVVYTLDNEQKYTGVYGNWIEKSGLTHEFLLGRTSRDIFGIESAIVHEKANLKALEGNSVTYEWQTGNDSDIKYYQTSLTPLRNSIGEISGLVGVARDITSLKLVMESLQKSELFLKKSQQVARIGSYSFDIKKGKWIASKTLDEIFGVDENFNKNTEGWLSIIHPEFKQVMADHLLKHVIEGKNRFDKEYKIIRVSDGEEIWVHGIGELEFDSEGKPIFMIGTIQDVSERKRAEEAIKESEEKFRTLFDTMPNGYYRSTHEGHFVDANPSFINMLGYKKLDELKALHIPTDLFVQSSEREEIFNSNPEFVSNFETYRLKRKDGSVIWVEDNARYIKDENGKVIFNEGICKDITDRKKAEDALRESEQLFNTLTQVSPVGIFRTRPDGYTTYVNPKWVRLSGISAEKAMGDGWLEAVHPEDRDKIKDGWNIATKDSDVSVAEYRFLRPNGNIIWVMGQAIPEFDAFNNIVGYVGTITDITERKLAEEALRESEERLRILAEKTGTIVYDINLNTYTVHREGAIKDVIGYSREEYNSIALNSFINLVHPEDRKHLLSEQKRIFKVGGNLTLFYRIKHKNGKYIFLEDNSITLLDDSCKGYRMLGSMKDITERKISEEALRESEKRLRILAEKTGTIVYDRDLITRKVHREGAIEEVLGYSREELNSFDKDQLELLIDEKEREQYFKSIKEIIKNPGSFSLNYKLKNKNGNFIYIEDNGIVLPDEGGKPVRILGSMRDVTLKKLAEDELRKLSHAVEQSQVSIVITNKVGTIEYVNPKFCEVTGFTYEEAIGQNPRILNSGEWTTETYTGMWSDLASGRNWTGIFHNKKKNGESFWESAHISPIKDFSGEITHYIAVKEDITDKVKTEEQLTKYREHLEEMVEERTVQLNSQNEFLRSLIDTIPNPLFVKDNEGKYTDVNPAFEKFFGVEKEKIIGKTPEEIYTGLAKELAYKSNDHLLKEKGQLSYETCFTNSEGNDISALVYKASFGSKDNKPDGIVGIFFDISQRKEMEEKTIQALNKEKELNEMKTNFISMASHEFRTPLTTILASADLVELYYNKWSEEKVINHVKKIQDSVNYMTSLLDDVLTLSRADRGKIKFSPGKVNLRDLCSQLMNEIQFQTLPGHELVMDYKLKDEVLTVDNKLLTQILNNLLSNAVKFSPEGGKILLEVTQKDDIIQFIVEDEGLGIDKNDLKNIFEPFFRGKNVTDIHGSGLGLNIVRNAVELHGGELSIQSELDKGTKITFTIRTS